MSIETPSTAFTTRLTGFVPKSLSSGPPPPRSKCTCRSLIDSNVDSFALIPGPACLPIRCTPRERSDRVSGDLCSALRTAETRDDKYPARNRSVLQKDSRASDGPCPEANPESDTTCLVPMSDRVRIATGLLYKDCLALRTTPQFSPARKSFRRT